jgi:hypothetical protein
LLCEAVRTFAAVQDTLGVCEVLETAAAAWDAIHFSHETAQHWQRWAGRMRAMCGARHDISSPAEDAKAGDALVSERESATAAVLSELFSAETVPKEETD